MRKERALAVTEASIVCGTDFSERAAEAMQVAAALATRLEERLVVAHAINWRTRAPLPEDLHESLCFYEQSRLYREIEGARNAGAKVEEFIETGAPEELLSKAAALRGGRLVVVGGFERKGRAQLFSPSVAERVAETAAMPTLIVRQGTPLLRWLAGKQTLRVLVGADLSAASEAALRWVNWLRQIGPCQITVVFFQAGPGAWDTIRMVPSPDVPEFVRKTELAHIRMFRKHVRTILKDAGARIRIDHGWSRSDAYLAHAAEDKDLLVVGAHQAHGLDRLGHHSVSRGVVRYCRTNIACVPRSTGGQCNL
jgi:nucleotide-binding universal stress UspA family protein